MGIDRPLWQQEPSHSAQGGAQALCNRLERRECARRRYRGEVQLKQSLVSLTRELWRTCQGARLTRRNSSWNRGSDRILSKAGFTLFHKTHGSRSSQALSSHS